MKKYTYDIFKNKLYSSTTKDFIDEVCNNYMYHYYDYEKIRSSYVTKEFNKNLKLFIDMIEAYKSECNHNLNISFYHPPKETRIDPNGGKKLVDVFNELYDYFVFFDDDKDYLFLTPEDIIYNMAKKIDNIDGASILFSCSTTSGVQRVFKEKAEELHDEYKNEIHYVYLNRVNPSTYKYLNVAYNIYEQLLKQKDNIKIGTHSENEIHELSLLLAAYKYKENNLTDLYDDNKLLKDYLEKHGLEFNKVLNALGVTIDMDKAMEDSDDCELSIMRVFKYIVDNANRNQLPIEIVHNLFNDGYTDFAIMRELFIKLSIDTYDFPNLNDISEVLNNNITIDKYMDVFNQGIAEYIIYLVNLYTYLEYSYSLNELSSNIDKKDLITLSILLSAYDYNLCGSLGLFLKDMNVTKNDVLNYAGITEYFVHKDFNYGKHNLYLFKDIIPSDDPNIFIGKIIDKVIDNTNTGSDLIQKIYYKVTGKSLDDNFNSTVDAYFQEKSAKNINELETKLLSDLSVDVYNYLKHLSNVYYDIKIPNANKGDIASLAIILTAIQYDNNIVSYFKDKGCDMSNTRLFNGGLYKKILNDFHINNHKEDIDISTIDTFFKDYIYDREQKDITVYSIVENGFKNDNTFLLKKLLLGYKMNVDDFTNISTDIIPFIKHIEEQREKEEAKTTSEHMYRACTELTKPLFDNSLKVFNYLLTHKNTTPIELSEEDMKIVSLYIGLFIVKDKNCEYFEQNGITLDSLLKALNIPESFINGINNENKQTLLLAKYKDDFKTDNSNIDIPRVIVYMLCSESLIKTINSNTDYHTLKDEVLNKKAKVIPPEEGLKMLESDIVPSLDASSLLSFTTYGDTLSKHSKIISDSLTELMMKDSILDNETDMNSLFESFKPKKKGLFKIFKSRKSKYNLNKDNLNNISDKVIVNRDALRSELKVFDIMRRYIEIYLKKLQQYVDTLNDTKFTLIIKKNKSDSEGIEEYTDSLNYDTLINIINNKISTFSTTIVLMKQELLKVHRLIISHNRAIDALDTASNTIIPLIGHEQLNAIGTRTEMETNAITNQLVNLLKNVVTYNELAAKDNLEQLKLTQVDKEELLYLTTSVNNCFDNPTKVK